MTEVKLPESRWTDTQIIEVEDGRLSSRTVRSERGQKDFEHSQSWGGGIGSEEELIAFGKIVRQIHDARIPTIVTTGTTGKSMRYAFKAAWRKLYPGEPVPALFHFPKGILRASLPTGIEGDPEPEMNPREKYPKLAQRLNKPVVVLDDFVDHASTMSEAKHLLEKIAPKGIRPEVKTAAIFAEKTEFPKTRIEKLDFCGKIKKTYRLDIHTAHEVQRATGRAPTIKDPGFHGTRRETHQDMRDAIRKRRELEDKHREISAREGYGPVVPLERSHLTRKIRPDTRIHRVRMEAFGEMAANHMIAQRQSTPKQQVKPEHPKIRRTFVRHYR